VLPSRSPFRQNDEDPGGREESTSEELRCAGKEAEKIYRNLHLNAVRWAEYVRPEVYFVRALRDRISSHPQFFFLPTCRRIMIRRKMKNDRTKM